MHVLLLAPEKEPNKQEHTINPPPLERERARFTVPKDAGEADGVFLEGCRRDAHVGRDRLLLVDYELDGASQQQLSETRLDQRRRKVDRSQ